MCPYVALLPPFGWRARQSSGCTRTHNLRHTQELLIPVAKCLTAAAFCALPTLSAATQTTAPPQAPALASVTSIAPPALPEAPGELPSAPSAQTPSATPAPATSGPQQTSRILGIIPNFRSVSAGTTLPPQTVHDKFKTGLADSFDYSAFVFVGIQAGIAQATDSYPEFHQGAAGYARYFWHTFADQADENLMVESIIPSLLHEDSRYYTLGHGGFVRRSAYAVSRALITRTDSGGETFNVAEIGGAGAASAISSTYYPTQYRTWTKVGQRWLTNVILDTATLYVKEFWPDVNSALSHKRQDQPAGN